MIKVTIDQADGKRLERGFNSDVDALSYLRRYVEGQTGEKMEGDWLMDMDEYLEQCSKWVEAYFAKSKDNYFCEELVWKGDQCKWVVM